MLQVPKFMKLPASVCWLIMYVVQEDDVPQDASMYTVSPQHPEQEHVVPDGPELEAKV